MSKTLEEIKEQYAKDFERASFEDMLWSYAESENGINDFIMIVDEVAERYAQYQTQYLTDWKESMTQIHSDLDLQGIGIALGLPLGTNIAPQVLPKVKELVDQNKELVDLLSLVCMDMEERGRAYGDAYIMSKELLTKYTTF